MTVAPGLSTTTATSSAGFVVFVSTTMAMTALATDVMLPAFPDIREAMGLAPESNQVGQLVTVFFLGLATAQLPAGLLADRFGRRPVLQGGLLVYVGGAIGTLLAPSLGWMLIWRFLWALGSGAARVIAVTVVRDRYAGAEMARTMSTVVAVFLLVPIVAPGLGSLLLLVGPWQIVFVFCAACALGLLAWTVRMPETLRPENVRPLRLEPIIGAAREVAGSPSTLWLTIGVTALMGAFTSYLAGSELMIEEALGLGEYFSLVFGGVAVAMGIASLTNGRLVTRLGLRPVIRGASVSFVGLSSLVLVIALTTGGTPPPALFLPPLALVMGNMALLLPNMNSAAMEPMGAMAGTAAAFIGAVSIAGGAMIGIAVGGLADGTVRPQSAVFAAASVVTLGCVRRAQR
jgi:MFS transporter, DHA1 family, multidrug resistance protein